MNRIEEILAAFEKQDTSFMPYYTLGYPNMSESLEIIQACAENGADLMELGIPFSDPLADGPTIQHSTQIAIENGTTVAKCLDGVKKLRNDGVQIPLILMGYYNPILAYGVDKFVADAHAAGANGFIIPDLPPEEAEPFTKLCDKYQLAINFLLAPNSPADRIKTVSAKTTGFIYLVSVMGITGARTDLPTDLKSFTDRVREASDKPIAVGFGISTPDQARQIGQIADGVIVGSALIKATSTEKDKPKAAAQFVKNMKSALKNEAEDIRA